jgi:hypothetical protein
MRLFTLCFGIAVLLAPAAAAQDLTVERDGDEVTITRPDGTVEQFTVDEDAPLRVHSKDGPLIIEREDAEGRSRVELYGEDGPRAFAFRMPPGAPPFNSGGFEFELEAASTVDPGSALDRALRFRLDSDPLSGERLTPWPGFGQRGVDPATRRDIADGEQQSRLLARQLRRADGADRDRLRQELRQTLERTFDLKQQARREQAEALEEDVERFQEELSELTDELSERDAARDAIIERREQELLGTTDELDW